MYPRLGRASYALVVALLSLAALEGVRSTAASPRDTCGVRDPLILGSPDGAHGSIDERGGSLSLGDHRVRVAVEGVGRGARRARVGAATPAVAGDEVVREILPGMVEWWRTQALGLEHGLTIREPPAGEGALVVDIRVDGIATRARSDDSVALVDVGGRVVATYAHLVVLDAHDRRLPARMVAIEGGVRVDIDDASAAYPIVVDPIVAIEEAILTAPAGAPGGFFGRAVAVSADARFVLVGAPREPVSGSFYSGVARMFARDATGWTLTDTFFSPTLRQYGGGYAVALSDDGSRAVVGLPNASDGSRAGGLVYRREGSAWVEEATLLAGWGSAPFEHPLTFVALSASGDRAIVGAEHDQAPRAGGGFFSGAGSARVFVRTDTSWSEEAVLHASDPASSDEFGVSVALADDGSRALVGAWRDTTAAGTRSGSARVFVRDGAVWTEEAMLTVPGTGGVGLSVALSGDGDRALLGGYPFSSGLAGSAHVFVRSGATWEYEAPLVPTAPAAGELYGVSVALGSAGDVALVGATGPAEPGGTVRIFSRIGTTWTESGQLTGASSAVPGDVGHAVALSERGVAVLGADGLVSPAAPRGSARVFSLAVLTEGASCWTDAACVSGFCVDGVCCATECAGGAGDCRACSLAAGGDTDGTCTLASRTTVCRPRAGPCDVADACAGVSSTCPPDQLVPAGAICLPGDAAQPCDVDDVCDGSSAACAPRFAPEATACGRAPSEPCDAPDHCSGIDGECVAILFGGVVCRASRDPSCDPTEVCDGAATSCPVDVDRCAAPIDAGGRDVGTALDAAARSDVGPDAAPGALPTSSGCACRVHVPSRRADALAIVASALILLSWFVDRRAARRRRVERPKPAGPIAPAGPRAALRANSCAIPTSATTSGRTGGPLTPLGSSAGRCVSKRPRSLKAPSIYRRAATKVARHLDVGGCEQRPVAARRSPKRASQPRPRGSAAGLADFRYTGCPVAGRGVFQSRSARRRRVIRPTTASSGGRSS